jgi:catechol 2,3-dioxygenase-like lactoylglutathione lyase family enzyme
MGSVLVHVGLTTSDIERSRRFYVEALGFGFDRELRLEADQIDALVRIEPKSDLRAVYLRLGDFTLELMQFDPAAAAQADARHFNQTGLAHLSIAVGDLAAAVDRIKAAGGSIVSHVGRACVARDPDGQLIELLDIAVHDEIEMRRATSASAG